MTYQRRTSFRFKAFFSMIHWGNAPRVPAERKNCFNELPPFLSDN